MNARDADTVTRPGPPDQVDAGPEAGRRPLSTDPWLRMDGHGASGVPAAGQPGHGRTASLRRQPVRIVEGRMKGGYTDVFELLFRDDPIVWRIYELAIGIFMFWLGASVHPGIAYSE